jgi:hypothetical protein
VVKLCEFEFERVEGNWCVVEREKKKCVSLFLSIKLLILLKSKLDFTIEKKLKEFVSNCGSPWAPQKVGVCLTK